jgi:hypothetical protein
VWREVGKATIRRINFVEINSQGAIGSLTFDSLRYFLDRESEFGFGWMLPNPTTIIQHRE